MFRVSMPNFATSSALVETATKCFGTAAWPSRETSHSRAERAFISVSWVVNVFEATMKSVLAGSRCFTVSARCVPSTLETKCARNPSGQAQRIASQAITGPRSEPPMPMLTMSEIRLPVSPFHSPLRRRPVKSRQHRVDLRHDVLAVDEDRFPRAVAQRHVQDRAILGAVDLLAREHPIAPGLHLRLPRQQKEKAHGLLGDAVLGDIDEQVLEAQGELLEAPWILGEEIAHVHVAHGRGVRPQVGPGLGVRHEWEGSRRCYARPDARPRLERAGQGVAPLR